MQVRAHKVRKRRRLDPDSPLLDFNEPPTAEENSTAALRASNGRWDEGIRVNITASPAADPSQANERTETPIAVEEPPSSRLPAVQSEDVHKSPSRAVLPRPPLAPFPRISAPAPKIIEFPRMATRQYELAEPVGDQLRIFEAIEDVLPPAPSHLNDIEIAAQEPTHFGGEIEVPIQAASLERRAFAAAVDAAVMIGALGLFAISAEFFATSLPMTKPLLAGGAICVLLVLGLYYLLSLSLGRSTAGMAVSGLRVITFHGDAPSLLILRWRALATVLSCAALGMGFAWSLIDEDRLCWHDRITRTYLIPK